MKRNVQVSPHNVNSAVGSMRLDLFLKISRVIPRRTLAHDVCDHGGVWVNGRMAKGSRLVKVGDLIQWHQPGKVRNLRVTRIPSARSGKRDASSVYQVISIQFPELRAAEAGAGTDSS